MLNNAEQLKDMVPVLLPIVVALVVVTLVLSLIRRVRRQIIAKRPQHVREIHLLSNIVLWSAMVIILLTLLEALEVPLGNVWTAVSTMMALVAIGFVAVWSILSHMTASLVLFFQRPFRPGEYLQLADDAYSGKVTKTGLFYTVVEDADGGRSQIPNNILFQRRFRVTSNAPVPEGSAAEGS